MKSKFFHSKKFVSVIFLLTIALILVLAATISVQTDINENNKSLIHGEIIVSDKQHEQPIPKESTVYYENPTLEASGVFISGNYAYVSDGWGLSIFNISNPTNPEVLAYESLTAYAFDVYVKGSYAYVADYASGLAVIDVSNPTNPGTPVYEDTNVYAYDVYVSGNYAYVADYTSGLAVIDVSNPTNPGTPVYEDTGGALGVYVSGNYAYVADRGNGLAIIDVSNPTNPGTPIYEDTPGSAEAVYISGNYAYIADYGSGLAIINISNPTDPVFIANESTIGSGFGYARSVFVSGDYAYVADGAMGLAIINVSDPTNPETPIYEDTTGPVMDVYVSGAYVYMADGTSGLAVVGGSPQEFFVHSPTDWVIDQTPTVICQFSEYVSGIDVSTVQYAYSTSGSITPSNWAVVDGIYEDPACTDPAEDGDMGMLYARVLAVPFGQDSKTMNTIRFRASDMVGNAGEQGAATVIRIDSTAPGAFSIFSPTDWVNDQSPTVICQFSTVTSGVDVSSVQYAYSTSGDSAPTNWATVDGVYEDAACTNIAEDNDTGILYARVIAVPFGQDSGSLNTIRFRANDTGGNIGTQNSAAIIQIESNAPTSFSIYSPIEWVSDQTPAVICQFSEFNSGINVSTVQYTYSILGASTPSNWAAVDGVYEDAACTDLAEDCDIGTLYARVISVPFGQDSETLNTIRFRANDTGGNIGTQITATIIRVDTSPIDLFELYSPKDDITDQTPTIIINFTCDLSGIDISSVEYAYSISGSITPTNWATVNGVYIDSSCTALAVDGTNGILFAKINAVPFNQYSETNNTIRLRASDIAGNANQSSAFLVKIISPPDSDSDDDDNENDNDRSSKAWYTNPLYMIIIGAIVGAFFLGLFLFVKRSKRSKLDKKFVHIKALEYIEQKTGLKIEKDKMMITPREAKTIEFEGEPEEQLEPIKERIVNSTEQKEIVEKLVALKPKLVVLEEFKVQISEYVRKEDRDILNNQINNLNDLIQQLEGSFKANQINQNAYVEQKAQYKAHLMNLAEKFETVSKELEEEIKNDLLATKESTGFVWVKRIEDSAEIYELNTGKIKLMIDDQREINKYLHEQKLTSGMVKRIGLTVGDQKLYVLAVFGMVLTKVFLIMTRNPGQILDVTLKQFSDDLDANFEQVSRNPAIIKSKIAQLLFQGL